LISVALNSAGFFRPAMTPQTAWDEATAGTKQAASPAKGTMMDPRLVPNSKNAQIGKTSLPFGSPIALAEDYPGFRF
jgi:hypothetical protein